MRQIRIRCFKPLFYKVLNIKHQQKGSSEKSQNGEKIMKNTQKVAYALLALMVLAVVASSIPAISAANIRAQAFVSVSPRTVGLGQELLVNGWIEPPPDIGLLFTNVYVDLKSPSGKTLTLGPLTTDSPGTFWSTAYLDEIGQWTATARWAGAQNYRVETERYGNTTVPSEHTYSEAVSQPYTFTVQQNPVPLYPEAELPTGYWDRPISSEMRSWVKIAGDWLYNGGFGDIWRPDDLGDKHVNPYSPAPKSSHIAWKLEALPSGLQGDAPQIAYTYGSAPSIDIIIGGVGYYQSRGLHAVDIRTGKELWVNTAVTGNPTFGQGVSYPYRPGQGSSQTTPSLWIVGSTIQRINAKTGAVMATYNGTSARATTSDISTKDAQDGVILYQTYSGTVTSGATWVTAWNSSKPGTTYSSKLVFNVSDLPAESGSGPYVYKDVMVLARSGSPYSTAYNATNGKLLWNITRDYNVMSEGTIGYGKIYYPAMDGRVHAWDVYTGEEVWASDLKEMPWGVFGAYSAACAYNKVYFQTYDGYIRCYDANDGHTVWEFTSGETFETPYNALPFYARPVVADGVIFAGETEHSATYPLYRGRHLYAFDANTGDVLWSIAGQFEGKAIADGVLVSTDMYTGVTFAFGKGLTSTTVTASPKTVNNNSPVLIEGSVLDQSPAQPGTPCVSKDSMTQQMEYLHMSRPKPTNNTGVPVTLYAQDSNGGAKIKIGSATTNDNGKFAFEWTPTSTGIYTITAEFEGDESYWSSMDTTAVSVGSASVPTPTLTSIGTSENATFTTADLAIIAVVFIAIIVGIVNILMLRKK